MNFKEYMAKRILIEEGYNFTNHEIKMLVEAGFMDGVKKFGRNAALAGALGAGALTMTGCSDGNCTVPQQSQTQQVQNTNKTDIGYGVTREISNKPNGTYYVYMTPQKSEDPRVNLYEKNILKARATNDFMKETGSNMQGVEWGLNTIKGHHGIWIKVSS